MKLTELLINQQVIVQIVWGEQKIEFTSSVLKRDTSGVYVRPYIHDDKPLEINIGVNSGIVCNIFADNKDTNTRVSWRNVKLTTASLSDGPAYFLKTSVFNQIASFDDRRKEVRMVVRKRAQLYDASTDTYTDILIHDISDTGISFYAPQSFTPKNAQFVVEFTDNVDDKTFAMKLVCTIARTDNKAGTVFYGCRIAEENRDYLLYGLFTRLKRK